MNLKNWIRERVVFLAFFVFVLGGAAYIGADHLFDPDSIWGHPIKEFCLLVSLIGVVSFSYELFLRELTFREYKEALQEIVNPDAVRLGIQGIYKNRSELGRAQSFEKLFKSVKNEIFIGGTSLLSISTSSRELLKERVMNGITVKLLLMDPESQVVDLITRQGGGKSTFKNEIKTSILLLQKLQEEIDAQGDASEKGNLIVHTYDAIPSHSFISLDAGETWGTIVADIGPYLGRSTPRPSMVVTQKKKGLFEYWHEMNNAMWEGSVSLQKKESKSAGAKIRTLVLISGDETEFYNSQTSSWQPATICQMNDAWRSIKGSQWIWVRESVTLEEAKTGTQNQFRKKFYLPHGADKSIIRSDLFVRSDDICRITVNDVGLNQEYGGSDYPDPFIIDIATFIKPGENIITFELINFAKPDATSPEDNPTGLIYRIHIEYSE